MVFLGLFSTRVPVYDGERLFLHVFPAWALLIGFGFGWLWDHRLPTPRRRIALGAFLLAQSFGLVALHPFGLSYYNGLVGGLPGAERLGLELTYWNDPVDQVLLDRLAREATPGASAALVPTLYPGQGILTTNRALARRGIILQDEEEATRAEWIVLSRRTAYWRPEIRERLLRGGRPGGRDPHSPGRVVVRALAFPFDTIWQSTRVKIRLSVEPSTHPSSTSDPRLIKRGSMTRIGKVVPSL